MSLSKKFGKKVKMNRTIRDWTLEDLAEKSCLGLTTIGNLERGLSSPTIDTVEKIAKAFGIPLHEMFLFDDVEKFL